MQLIAIIVLYIYAIIFLAMGDMDGKPFGRILNIWNTLIIISNVFFIAITYLQMIEMIAMRYIIMTQKDRKVEEILFDHEHEDIHNQEMRKPSRKTVSEEIMFSFDDIQYRRREIRLKKRLN